ncbi:MAG: hypothetical protein COY39_03865 [Alphaproteobacteria bacterium CG_4_10_14_0_8_um_filter_37_21]|nr:MAG: hypothetical protein COY39_03865 [Alphaproteobacteria bacterium CG_4_10_14_0_8_um_filter_37_21]
MKKIIITFSILSLGIACAAEDANRLPVSDDALSSALIPEDKIPHYHGIPDAKNIYKVESQKVIASLGKSINIWRKIPGQFTKISFWTFLENLGKKRQAIAEKCKSEDKDIFGCIRDDITSFTDLHPYGIMRDFVAGALETMYLIFSFSPEQQSEIIKNLKAPNGKRDEFLHKKGWTRIEREIILEKLKYQQQNFPENSKLFIYSTSLSGEEALSRRFCLSITHASDGNSYMNAILQTHGSASKDSPAISELYDLFKDLLCAPTPESAFKFFHKFAVTMPYKRGSSAVNEWILATACDTMGIPMPKQSVFAEFDQMAQISTREDFVQFMMTKIPLQQ